MLLRVNGTTHLLLTSYTLIMFLILLSHLIMKIKVSWSISIRGTWNIYKNSTIVFLLFQDFWMCSYTRLTHSYLLSGEDQSAYVHIINVHSLQSIFCSNMLLLITSVVIIILSVQWKSRSKVSICDTFLYIHLYFTTSGRQSARKKEKT